MQNAGLLRCETPAWPSGGPLLRPAPPSPPGGAGLPDPSPSLPREPRLLRKSLRRELNSYPEEDGAPGFS